MILNVQIVKYVQLILRRITILAVALVVVLCCAGKGVHAQGLSSSGTDFWVGFFPNEYNVGGGFFGDTSLTELFLASTAIDTALVTYDGITTAYPLTPNSVVTVGLQGRGITDSTETPSYNAVHVQSRAPIVLFGFYDRYTPNGGGGGSPDGFLGLPTVSLGTEYYTVNYSDANNFLGNCGGEFLVIAPYDSTLVTITTKAHTATTNGRTSHAPDDTWDVMLMRGQSYLVQSTGKYPGIDDLTGSHVVTSKPVALLTGHMVANIPLSAKSADYLIEMLPPIDRWGTEYFDMPMAGRTICGDYIRMISAEDSNVIKANDSIVATLNAGEWAEMETVTTPQVFTSANKKRFIVAQYSYSAFYLGDTVPADPFMILMTPKEQFVHHIVFRTPDPAQDTTFANYLTIIAPADSMSTIIINGLPATSYPSAGQTTFPSTSPLLGGLRVHLPDGSHSYTALSNVSFGMYQYGYSSFEGYGWPAGTALALFSPDTLVPAQTYVGNCGDYVVTIADTRRPPQYSFTDSRIADIQLITQPGDLRWSKPSYNYAFQTNPPFHLGDSIATYYLSVIDPSKPAYAAVWVVDNAGNDTVYEYSNQAPSASAVNLATTANDKNLSVAPGQAFDLDLTVKDLTGPHNNLAAVAGMVTSDDDALSLLSTVGVNGWTITSTTVSPGVTQLQCVPPATSAPLEIGEKIASLHFEAFLAKTMSSQINIGNVTVGLGNNSLLPCGSASVEVSIGGQCGDSVISRYIATGKLLYSIRTYPNPAHGSITVATTIPSDMNATLYLYNALGAQLGAFAVNPGEEEQTMPIPDLSSGIYFLRLRLASGGVLTREIVVE